MVKTKTLTQRVTALEERLDKIERELEAEDNLLPPDLTPEEREQQELLDRYHRIGF